MPSRIGSMMPRMKKPASSGVIRTLYSVIAHAAIAESTITSSVVETVTMMLFW